MTPIEQLQQRLSDDSVTLENLQVRYREPVQANFYWCDSMLQYLPEEQVNDCFEVLNLTQAYLSQFDEMLPVMRQTISYSRQQLTLLQSDIDTHYLSDSLAAVYLADETAVADTLHHRVAYFEDRLSHQEKELKALRKTISKAASK